MFWESFENAVPKSAVSENYEEIFVAPNGSPAGDGTKSNPFNSIKAAKEKAAELSENQSGDIIVNIAPGYYFLSETEVFEPAHSGKNGHNIIYRGDSENKPIISGGIEVNGWEEVENGIYKAKVPAVSDTRTFYIDDKPAVRAKSAKKYTVSSIDADNAALTVNNANFPDLQNPENAEVVFNISWANKRIPIEKIEKTVFKNLFRARCFRCCGR